MSSIKWVIYNDPYLPIHPENTDIPQDRPYNIKTKNGKIVTFMTGKAYRIYCKNNNIEIKKFDSRDNPALHKHVASLFDITEQQAKELCEDRTKNNARHINKKLKNLKPVGFQAPDGDLCDEKGLCCRLSVEVGGELVCAGVFSDGRGVLYHGFEGCGRFSLL